MGTVVITRPFRTASRAVTATVRTLMEACFSISKETSTVLRHLGEQTVLALFMNCRRFQEADGRRRYSIASARSAAVAQLTHKAA